MTEQLSKLLVTTRAIFTSYPLVKFRIVSHTALQRFKHGVAVRAKGYKVLRPPFPTIFDWNNVMQFQRPGLKIAAYLAPALTALDHLSAKLAGLRSAVLPTCPLPLNRRFLSLFGRYVDPFCTETIREAVKDTS